MGTEGKGKNMNLNDDKKLMEDIAEAVHNAWMKGRTGEGWVYGPVKNVEKREDPNIRPYADIPESEKEYDRNTAKAVISTLLEKGYRIEKIQR